MKVGDYVRTEDGKIAKVIDIEESLTFAGYEKRITTDKFKYSSRDTIIIKKSSPNIIDLIEVGDYVNGKEITGVDEYTKQLTYEYGETTMYIGSENIKSIVTKEQFESMEYKVKE